MQWLVQEGAELEVGDEVAEVETEKINGIVESPGERDAAPAGGRVGDVVPVGGLLGVLADADVGDEEIDAFVAEFQATFVRGGRRGRGRPGGRDRDRQTVAASATRECRRGARPRCSSTASAAISRPGSSTRGRARGRASVIAFDLPGHGGSSKDVGAGASTSSPAVVARARSRPSASSARTSSVTRSAAVATIAAAPRAGRVADARRSGRARPGDQRRVPRGLRRGREPPRAQAGPRAAVLRPGGGHPRVRGGGPAHEADRRSRRGARGDLELVLPRTARRRSRSATASRRWTPRSS